MTHADPVSPPRPTGLVARRATLVDIAYSRLEVSGRPALRIGTLIESINDPHIVINGVRRTSREAWTMALRDVLAGVDPPAVTLTHPTAWGSLRTTLLANALHDAVAAGDDGWDADVATSVSPRAVVVAESHMEPSAQTCVVAECHDGRLDVHRLHRADGRWSVTATVVFDDAVSDEQAGREVGPLVTDAVEAVLIDGDNRDRVAATLRLFEDHTPTGRIAAVERVLLHRYGGTPLSTAPGPPAPSRPSRSAPSRMQAASIAAASVLVLVGVVTAVVVVAPWRSDTDDVADAPRTSELTPPTGQTVQVGRVSVAVPAGWRRSGDRVDAAGAVPFTAFAARTDDRRLIVVQNAVRAGSTLDSVALSLRNRLDQRGTDVVTEFSPMTRFGGRDVISYRETPVSGGAIRWYVVVDSALQVSLGCQEGSQGQSPGAECTAAVGSIAIAP